MLANTGRTPQTDAGGIGSTPPRWATPLLRSWGACTSLARVTKEDRDE